MSSAAPSLTAPSRRSRLWRLLFFLVGLALLTYLLQQVGLRALLEQARRVGWTFLAIVAVFGGVHLLRTLSWRVCLREDGHKLPVGSAFGLWLAGESMSYLSVGWSGEAFRAVAAGAAVPVARNLSALFISRVFYMYASLLLTGTSFLLCPFLVPLGEAARSTTAVAAVLLLAITLLPLAGRASLERVARPLGTLLARHPRSPLSGRLQGLLHTFEEDLAALFSQGPRMALLLMGLNLLATLAGVVEVYLVLRALGASVSLPTALLIEGMSKVLSVFTYFIPGSLGVREGGVVLIFQLLQMSAAAAVTMVLVRRARALVWVGLGSLLVTLHGVSPLVRARPAPGSNAPDDPR